jgi:hypothetical protein
MGMVVGAKKRSPESSGPQERKDDVVAKLLRALLRTCNVRVTFTEGV